MIRTFVLLFFLCLVGVFQVESHEVQSVMLGDSVTLDSKVSEVQLTDEIVWRFDNSRIVKAIKGNPKYDDERFRDRLKLERNGSLTINDTRTTDTGVYKFRTIINNKELMKTFSVIVYAPVPVPVIFSDTSQCSLSSERSSRIVLCSVLLNVSDVTLSWYKGISVLSSISVSDLSISLSLPLEVEYQDKNTYRCVINNPVSNQTKDVCITDLCQLFSDDVSFLESTEAVIRLVIIALVSVADVAVFFELVYDIRSHSAGSDTLQQE